MYHLNKPIKRSIPAYFMLSSILGLSSVLQAATPSQQLDALCYHSSQEEQKKVYKAATLLPPDQRFIPANEQCRYTTIITGDLLPIRQTIAEITASKDELFGLQHASDFNELHQSLQNPTQDLSSFHSKTFCRLVTDFMARMEIEKGTWGHPEELQTIANKLKINIQAHYFDPSNPTKLVQSPLTNPAEANSDITIHIVRDTVHPEEGLIQATRTSAKVNLHYQHYRLKYMLAPSISTPLLTRKRPSRSRKKRSTQKSLIRPCLVVWFEAAKMGNRQLLSTLYSNYRIRVGKRNENSNTAALYSATNGHLNCLRYLLQKGADIHDSNENKYTPLLLSAYKGHLDCVKYLVEQGADINTRDHNGNTALLSSIYYGHLDCVAYLVEKGAFIHDKNKNGNTATLYSAANGHLDCLRYLLQKGADIHDSNKDTYTPLLLSAYNGHLNCVKYLVEQGADINARDHNSNTALLLSTYYGHVDCLAYLVEKSTRIHDKDENGNTPLLLSAYRGHLNCLKYLMQQGANINDKDEKGNTALLLSAYSGHLDCLKYLMRQGANINTIDKHGYTALLLSACNGHLACVKYLVQQRANVTFKGNQYKTALEWAKKRKHQAVVNYLSKLCPKKCSFATIKKRTTLLTALYYK